MQNKDSIGIGIIGTGFARTTQLPAFKACAGARLVAIASGQRANAERVAREFDIPFVADDWRAVVERADVDLVSIVTPPVTHREMALAALAAGKAVLCEKPMAMDAGETGAMSARARELHACALVDHELRFLAGRHQLHALLRADEIGRVRHVRFTFRADARAPHACGIGGRTRRRAAVCSALSARTRLIRVAGCSARKSCRSARN